jgi:hypothetical protein
MQHCPVLITSVCRFFFSDAGGASMLGVRCLLVHQYRCGLTQLDDLRAAASLAGSALTSATAINWRLSFSSPSECRHRIAVAAAGADRTGRESAAGHHSDADNAAEAVGRSESNAAELPLIRLPTAFSPSLTCYATLPVHSSGTRMFLDATVAT